MLSDDVDGLCYRYVGIERGYIEGDESSFGLSSLKSLMEVPSVF